MKIGDYHMHPAADVFPMMDVESFRLLVEDIREHGLRERILIDEEDLIVDGRNRLKACIEAGVEPRFTLCRLQGKALLDQIVSRNFHRRHLNRGQLAVVGAELVPHYAAAAKARMAQGGRGGLEGAADRRGLAEKPRPAAQDAAEASGAAMRSVEKAVRVKYKDKKLFNSVKNGKMSLNAAHSAISDPAKRKPPSTGSGTNLDKWIDPVAAASKKFCAEMDKLLELAKRADPIERSKLVRLEATMRIHAEYVPQIDSLIGPF